MQTKKFLLYSKYMSASPSGAPSVTSGLRMSVQPAKSASPIGHSSEKLRKFYVFFGHKIFTT